MDTNLPTRANLSQLMEAAGGPFASLYLPTRTAGAPTRENAIRFKNLCREAEERLASCGLRAADAREIVAPALSLVSDSDFWQRQGEGLAAFIGRDRFEYYRMPNSFKELVVVGSRFHIKPLLPAFAGDGTFYVLALSQNKTRLLQGSHFSINEFAPEQLPQGLADTLYFIEEERQLQWTTGTPNTRGERRRAVFHGHGVGTDAFKKRIVEYFHQLDSQLRELVGERRIPLVLAGVEYLLPLYRESTSYPFLIEEGIIGNPDVIPARELHQRAWEIVSPAFRAEREKAANGYRQMYSTRLATDDIRRIIPASNEGRVSVLFAALDNQQWGYYDPETRAVEIHESQEADDEDLLDVAAVNTLARDGVVWVVPRAEMPSDASAAAIFRF